MKQVYQIQRDRHLNISRLGIGTVSEPFRYHIKAEGETENPTETLYDGIFYGPNGQLLHYFCDIPSLEKLVKSCIDKKLIFNEGDEIIAWDYKCFEAGGGSGKRDEEFANKFKELFKKLTSDIN